SVTVTGQTIIGNFAPASVIISNGGVLNSQGSADIATFLPFLGTPTVTVTGPGSTWNVGGPFGLFIGDVTVGPGALTIANGGVVNSTTSTIIGDASDGSSKVIVTGAGSVLNAFNSLAIGASSCGCNPVGTLTVADGGVVNSPGATSIGAGSTLNLGVGGLAGAIVTPAVANDGQIVANFTDTLTLAAAISGAGALRKAGPGTLILTRNNTYTGATTINGGTLSVNGSIADSTVTVNAGGRLGGTGTLGNTIINGGTLSPGNSIGTLTVNGNLTMTAAASYLVEISPTNADRTNVAGTATLAGTVQAAFAAGSYVTRNYTILSAAGGRSGTFSALTTANLPPRLPRSPELSRARRDPQSHCRTRRADHPRRAERAGRIWRARLRLQHKPVQRRQRAQRVLQHRRHAAARIREHLRAHRRQPRQCAHAALWRGGDRRAAGRVPTHQPVPRHHARSVRRRPQRVRRRRQRRDRFCAGARRAARGHRARLRQGAQGPAQAGELRRALERVGCRLWRRQPHVRRSRNRRQPRSVRAHRGRRGRARLPSLPRQRNRRRARRRRHQLVPRAGDRRRQERCVPGRRLRRDAMGPGLSRR